MKKVIYVLWIAVMGISCNSMGKSEQAILEYMRNQTGSPKLKIEFANVQIIKQTVGDSINILQEKYVQDTTERAEKIKQFEDNILKNKERLKSLAKDNMMYSMFIQNINMEEQLLKQWNEKVITNEKGRYDGQDKNKVIATIVHCQMTSLVNPVLKATQTKEGSFLLTPDESKCIRQLN